MKASKQASLRWRRVATAAIASGVLVAAVGCGSDDNSSSGSSAPAATTTAAAGATTTAASGGDASGVAEAKALVTKYKTYPTEFPITKPIGKPVPTGKLVVYIDCGVSICATLSDGAKRAAAVLGWKYQSIASGGTPEGLKKAWQTAVRLKPAAVLSSGFDTPGYKDELAQLQKMHVYVGNYATTDPGPQGGVDYRIQGPQNVAQVGDQFAAWIVADTDGKANTLLVDVPAFTILKPVAVEFQKKYKELCPTCKTTTIEIPITSVGKDAPQRIVSYLRAHPDVNYLAFPTSTVTVGLPAALKAAGLADKVKFMGSSGPPESYQYIKDGTQAADVNQSYYENMAALMDGAARHVVGESLDETKKFDVQFWTEAQDNERSDKGLAPQIPDLYGKLAKLWGKG